MVWLRGKGTVTRSTPREFGDLATVADRRGKHWKYSQPSDTWCLINNELGPGSISQSSARSWDRLLYEFGPLERVLAGTDQTVRDNYVITEHAIAYSGGSMLIRDPDAGKVYPTETWLTYAKKNGQHVFTRRVIVLDNWREL